MSTWVTVHGSLNPNPPDQIDNEVWPPTKETPVNDEWKIRLAVQDCISRYAVLFDAGRFDELAELFTDDAVFDISPDPSFMTVPLRGRAQIMDNISQRHEEVAARGEIHQHVCTNTIFDLVSDSRCDTQTYLTTIAGGPEIPPRVQTFGVYHDTLEPHGDGWRFAKRHVKMRTEIP
jgi:hypothetical protein